MPIQQRMADDAIMDATPDRDMEVFNDEVKVGILNKNEDLDIPKEGMVFGSQEDVRNYYDKYAQQLGFTTIKRSTKSGDDGNIKYFTLACARCGRERTPTNNNSFHCRKRLPPKTNCKARINITVGPDGRVSLCRVVLEHNHELVPGILRGFRPTKQRGPRAMNRREGKDKIRTKLHQDSHSVVLEAGGSENLTSDSAMQRVNDLNQITSGSNHPSSPKTAHSLGVYALNVSTGRSSVPANSQFCQEALDCALAKCAAELVKSGMVIGIGSGSTISFVIEELGRLIKEGKLKDIIAVAVNYQSQFLAKKFGMAITDMNGVNNIDIAFDGVNEVDFNKNLLKSGGPAQTMQKVVNSVANKCIILADYTKIVHRLGSKFPVPVEVLPPALSPVLKQLVSLGGAPETRSASTEDGPLFTDLGNMVVDVSFPNGIQNPSELEKNIKMIPGVVENGIVTGIATVVLVAVKDRGSVNVMNLEDYVRVVLDRRESDTSLTS